MGNIYDRPPKPAPASAIPALTYRQQRMAQLRRLGWRVGFTLAAIAVGLIAHLVWRAHRRVAPPPPRSDTRFSVIAHGRSTLPASVDMEFAQVQQAYALMQASQLAEAERVLLRVLGEQSDYDPALRMLALLHLRRGRLTDARAVFTRALKNPGTRAETLNNLATVMMRQDALAEAERALLAALALEPDHAGANLNLGLLYITWKQYDKAAEHFETARALLPDHPGLLNNLAVCRMRTGQPAAARDLLRRAIANGPEAAPPLFNVAMTYALETNAADALVWIRQARALCTATEAYAVLADPDFEPVRRQPVFMELVAGLRAEANAAATNRTAR